MPSSISPLAFFLLILRFTWAQTYIFPSNISSSNPSQNPVLTLPASSGSGPQYYSLLPLVGSAQFTTSTSTLNAQLLVVNSANISDSYRAHIVLLSCDPQAGYISPDNTFGQLVAVSPAAIILYSNTTSSCQFNNSNDQSISYLYTLLSGEEATTIINTINTALPNFYASIQRGTNMNNSSDGNNGSGSTQTGGSSPNTAVAMIILYSITGVITALFLVIIITGAIRAHRHPERYGPRAALGRPRQTRVKGIARAMLDTIPIVKWGDDDKPEERANATDVEMASGANGPSAVVASSSTPLGQAERKDSSQDLGQDSNQEKINEKSQEKEKNDDELQASQISQENIGCSICTDDFEKGQDVRVLPCKHQFHPACIDPWLLNVSGTCPLCRIDLRPEAQRQNDADITTSTENLPPPLDDTNDPANRRMSRRQSLVLNLLNPRAMRDASTSERIAALRSVRQDTQTDEVEARRRRRITMRLQDVFSVMTTRNRTADATTSSNSIPSSPTTLQAPTNLDESTNTPSTSVSPNLAPIQESQTNNIVPTTPQEIESRDQRHEENKKVEENKVNKDEERQ